MRLIGTINVVVANLIFVTSMANAGEIVGKPRVIDGDTIEISGQRIRLHGIDAPETKQICRRGTGSEYRCGTMATFSLAELIEEHWVKCVGHGLDRYGRMIATWKTGPVNLNEEMVKRGWALAYKRYSYRYSSVEKEARGARRGLWQGAFTRPWDWRRGIRIQDPRKNQETNQKSGPVDPDCNIKGNISHSGDRIYHLPGSRYYAKTKISIEKSERWFCSESEAVRAGWRAAK